MRVMSCNAPTILLASLLAGPALAQMSQPILGENATKISDHVWAIMGWPNVAIIVGERATLIVDTGLGPRNGATVAKVAAKLSPNQKLFLTTTHFHPEHAGGEPGFPPNTILIRDAVQQKEMEAHGMEMIEMLLESELEDEYPFVSYSEVAPALSAVLASSEQLAQASARTVIHRLGEAGWSEFRKLLTLDQGRDKNH